MCKLFFHTIELSAFILPALPANLSVRLSILFVYFILHYYKAQTIYSRIKNSYTVKDSTM